MSKRHTANILNFIDEAIFTGVAEVSKELLVKCWYGQDRMSKTIWRDIVGKLPEDCDVNDYSIFEWADKIVMIDKTCLHDLSDLT